MSHITTLKTDIQFTQLRHVEAALLAMSKDKELTKSGAFTYTKNTDSSQIKVRYAPIETYQRNGNLTLNKNKEGAFEVKGDPYQCNAPMKNVISEFQKQYMYSVGKEALTKNGYTIASSGVDKAGNMVLVGRQY